jgi:polysaccharide export outer membrane protein
MPAASTQEPAASVPPTHSYDAGRSDVSLSTRTPRYELCASDSFDIAFPYASDFNQTVTVQPDGFVTLREIGDLHVAGLTVPQLTDLLTQRYGEVLHEPVVTVTLKDFNRPYFTVGGQVGKPGRFELRSDTTITEAIAVAGGFDSTSKHSQVLLVRKVSSQWAEVKTINVKRLYKSNMSEDIHLRSGDMLYVPKNTLSKVKPWIPIYGAYLSFLPF